MSKLGNETLCPDDAQAKQRAQAIKARMADLGHTIPLTHAYEIMATSYGYRNWPTMKAVLRGSAAMPPPRPSAPIDIVTDGMINELAVTFEGDPNIVKRVSRLGRGKVELIVGPPGKGKSTLLDALNILEVQARLQSGTPLPQMFILGSGHTHKDFILAVEDALPPGRKGEVVTVSFSRSSNNSLNPFDTSLGFRRPTARHKHALIEFLMTAAGENGETVYPDLWRPILHQLIDRLYDLYADGVSGRHQKQFSRTKDHRLTQELMKLGLLSHGKEDRTWWEVVDDLCSRGLYDVAELAQRQAVPNIDDFLTLVSGADGADCAAAGDLALISLYLGRNTAPHPFIGRFTTVDTKGAKIVVMDHEWLFNPRAMRTFFSLSRLYMGRDLFLQEDECVALHPMVLSYHQRKIEDRSKFGVGLIYDDLERFDGPQLGEALTRDAVSIQEIGGTMRAISQVSSCFKSFDMAAATDLYLLSHPALHDRDFLRRFDVDYKKYEGSLNRLTGPGRGGLNIAVFSKVAPSHDPVVLLKMSAAALWATTASTEDALVRDELAKMVGLAKAIRVLTEWFPTQNIERHIEKVARERAATSAEHSYSDLLVPVRNELIEQLASNL